LNSWRNCFYLVVICFYLFYVFTLIWTKVEKKCGLYFLEIILAEVDAWNWILLFRNKKINFSWQLFEILMPESQFLFIWSRHIYIHKLEILLVCAILLLRCILFSLNFWQIISLKCWFIANVNYTVFLHVVLEFALQLWYLKLRNN